jgi:hypothetical protein
VSISVYKTWVSGEILTAADLNSSFSQFANNGTDAAFPLTKTVGAGGFVVTNLGLGVATTDAASLQNIINAGALNCCEFRLTLTTATPVTTGEIAGAATLYWTPFMGNKVALYDGTNWNIRTSAELSLAVAGLAASKPHDIFIYDNAGTPTIESLVWTNDTTRATALTTQNGVLVKSGATSRRYVGTVYTNSSPAFYDTTANRWVWNYYNRVTRQMLVLGGTGYAYTTATIRQAGGAAANQLDFLIGYGEDAVSAQVVAGFSNVSNANVVVGIGLDSTTTIHANCLRMESQQLNSTLTPLFAFIKIYPGVGRHFLAWLEYSDAVGTTNWVGSGTANSAPGIHGEMRS